MGSVLARAAASPATTKLAPSVVSPLSLFQNPRVPLKGIESLNEKILEAKKKANPHGYSEIARILALPVIHPLSDAEYEEYVKHNTLSTAPSDFKMFRAQAEALCAYDNFQGVFCPISVGAGKTLISLSIASKAYAKGIKKILLLVPSNVYEQLVKNNLAWTRKRVPINVPFVCMGNTTRENRIGMARSGRTGCYILPYSCLSTKDSSELLEYIAPQCIIADEADAISDRKTARTKRILYYLNHCEKQGIKVEMIPMSGTITNKSIMEYHHLIRASLKDNCPLPLSPQMASEWGQFIDAEADYTGANPGPIAVVVEWAKKHFPNQLLPDDVSGFRAAYKLRLNTAPGVVSTVDSDVDCALTITTRPVSYDKLSDDWIALDKLMTRVTDEYIAPNGDQIEHAIHTFRWLFELSAGFFNNLTWPTAEHWAERKGVSKDEAAEVLERAKQHHDLHQIFSKELRKWMSAHNKPGLDTPLLVKGDMARHGKKNVSADLYAAWQDMKHAEFENMPERESTPVRICDFKVKGALEWAKQLKKGEGAIIWVYNNEILDWVWELCQEAGLDPIHCKAGNASNNLLLDEIETSKRLIVASISAHGRGKNLQYLREQYCVQWPRPAKQAEQLLGRLHRKGQVATEIAPILSTTTMFDQLNFAACLNDALYIHQTTGNRQRLIYAGYDPIPTIFPPSVLRERGFEPKLLSTEHQAVMREMFGDSKPKS